MFFVESTMLGKMQNFKFIFRKNKLYYTIRKIGKSCFSEKREFYSLRKSRIFSQKTQNWLRNSYHSFRCLIYTFLRSLC